MIVGMVKLLHTADVHLDSPLRTLALRDPDLAQRIDNATRTALARIVDIAIEERVAAVLIAGDLYDGGQRSMTTAAFLIAQFRRLQSNGIQVFLIRGNHDAESRITKEIGWPENVHRFDGHGGHKMLDGTDIAIHGVSFANPHAPESLVGKFRPVEGAVNIAMLHTSLAGAPGHDPYAPCTVADLVSAGFDYWALGHVHVRTVHHQTPFVVMPGMPQGRDIGEDGPKSATLIHVQDGSIQIEERPTAEILFRRLDCDLTGAQDMDQVHSALRRVLDGLDHDVPSVVRIRLTGQTELVWQIRRDLDLIREVAEQSAQGLDVWIDKIVADIEAPAIADSGAAGELANLIAQIATEPGFAAQAEAALGEVVDDLPAELRGTYGADADGRSDAARRLIEQAVVHAVARIHSVTPDAD